MTPRPPFGVRQNTVSTWRKRGTIPYGVIITFCEEEGISLDLLFFGKEKGQPAEDKQDVDLLSSPNLIFEVMERTELLFEKHDLYLPPRKKAKLIKLLYEEILENESAMDAFDEKVISITRGLAV